MLVSSSALVLYAALNTCFLQRPKVHRTREISTASSQQAPVLGVTVDLADLESAHRQEPTTTPLLSAEAVGPAAQPSSLQDHFDNAEITVVSARAVDGRRGKDSRNLSREYGI